ncbi:MAG: rplD [Rickettsiaceae bacterium]|jgi:large subunit ribosomal protein L4|nr:rplD [Rickettsiaceae bacterium]
MKAKVVTLAGKNSGEEVTLSKDIFGLELRSDILHRVVNWQLAKRQAGTHSTKERNDVRGGAKKPYRQKGTGNARQGSTKGPHMRGGAVVFGPHVRSHAHSLPKKIRALGLKIALSSKVNSGSVYVLKDDLNKDFKTAQVAKGLEGLGIKSALIIGGEQIADNFRKAVANIKEVDLLPVQGANVYDILRRKNLILTEDAIKKLEERLNG